VASGVKNRGFSGDGGGRPVWPCWVRGRTEEVPCHHRGTKAPRNGTTRRSEDRFGEGRQIRRANPVRGRWERWVSLRRVSCPACTVSGQACFRASRLRGEQGTSRRCQGVVRNSVSGRDFLAQMTGFWRLCAEGVTSCRCATRPQGGRATPRLSVLSATFRTVCKSCLAARSPQPHPQPIRSRPPCALLPQVSSGRIYFGAD
jgi:hypothetical protein